MKPAPVQHASSPSAPSPTQAEDDVELERSKAVAQAAAADDSDGPMTAQRFANVVAAPKTDVVGNADASAPAKPSAEPATFKRQ
ncbi:hypothetical protein [Variovorax guangxiensis]|uniref:hypothetical protein n=1 Tax=Variovorax guangxiensis TaxID=1775474 RepID=UPI0028603AD6|nr:hypothetical protein [Variovorax guangxiensis]MDR6858642.1 hypothetical protein [Variovorax guangxiensis]